MLVAVSEMVLAELPGGIAVCLQHVGDGRVERAEPELRSRQTDLRQAGADRRLSGDKSGSARGAALLPVPIGEQWCARRSWRDPAGGSPARVSRSGRSVARVAGRKATTVAKRTQRLRGVGY